MIPDPTAPQLWVGMHAHLGAPLLTLTPPPPVPPTRWQRCRSFLASSLSRILSWLTR
jgi:hypothetical protein